MLMSEFAQSVLVSFLVSVMVSLPIAFVSVRR